MGLFDKRTTEILMGFNALEIEAKEITWYLPKLTEYTKKCDVLVTELSKGVKDVDIKDPEEAEQWAKTRDKLLGEAVKAKPDLSKYRDVPSLDLLAYHTQLQLEEAAFMGALKKSNVGDEFDAIAKIAFHLKTKTADLERLWKDTLDKDQDFDRKAQDTAKEIQKAIDNAIDKAAANNRTLIETFAELVKINDGIPEGLPNLISMIPGEFGTAAAVILKGLASSTLVAAKLNELVLDRERKLKELFRKEGNLMVVFSATRKEVEEFAKTTNLDVAKVSYTQAEKELDGLAGAVKTSGQKDVMNALKREVMAAMGKVLDTAEKHHNDFVREHKSKFFGPVSSDIKEQLFETRNWSDLLRDFETQPLHRKLEEFYGKNLLSVTLGKLEPEVKEYIDDRVRRDFDQAMKVIRDIDRKLTGQPPERQIENLRKIVESRVQ